jgi:hypothetical protein
LVGLIAWEARQRPETGFLRSTVILAFAAVIYALGSRIPLPGLNIEWINGARAQGWPFFASTAKLSIFSLGTMPIFIVLIPLEIARLLFPSLTKWETASTYNADRLIRVVRGLMLIVAGIQGYALAMALDGSRLVEPRFVSFVPVGVASYVGSTAFLIWLAGRIRFPGAVDGVWSLFALQYLAGLVDTMILGFRSITAAYGNPPLREWGIVGIYTVIAIALVVVAHLLLRRRHGHSVWAIGLSPAVLLWPPLLANAMSGWLVLLLSRFFPREINAHLFVVVGGMILAAVLPLFVYGYARRATPGHHPLGPGGVRLVVLLIMVLEVAICGGNAVLSLIFPHTFIPAGEPLIVLATVLFVALPQGRYETRA